MSGKFYIRHINPENPHPLYISVRQDTVYPYGTSEMHDFITSVQFRDFNGATAYNTFKDALNAYRTAVFLHPDLKCWIEAWEFSGTEPELYGVYTC